MRRTTALRTAVAAMSVAIGTMVLASMSPAEASAPAVTDTTLTNPSASGTLASLTKGRLAERGGVSAFLYQQTWGARPWVTFHESSSGATTNVALSSTSVSISEWQDASLALTGDDRLVVLSGAGPVHIREFELSGAPLPTAATLVRTTVLGDADSRPGDLIGLRSGALVAVWHQQGDAGPQGYSVAHQPEAGAVWSITPIPAFMPSYASKQVVAQHPADDSIWVFTSPDAWGRIGVVHLTEGPNGIVVDGTDDSFLAPEDGAAAPDPENPWLSVASDAATGTLALAYQSADRRIFSTAPVVTGSKPAVTRISASGATSTIVLPTYVERVSSLTVSVAGGTTWLAHRPVDAATLQFDDLHLAVHDGIDWHPSIRLGQLAGAYERVAATGSAHTVAARLSDGRFHYFTDATSGSPTSSSTTTVLTSTTITSTTSTTAAPTEPTKKPCKGKRCR